jgi:hypothetical protein
MKALLLKRGTDSISGGLRAVQLLCLTLLAVLALATQGFSQQVARIARQHAHQGSSHQHQDGKPEDVLNYFDKQIFFIENRGQWESPVLFKADFPLGKAIALKDGMAMTTFDAEDLSRQSEQGMRSEEARSRGEVFSESPVKVKAHTWLMQFKGASAAMKVESKHAHADQFNYFKGNVSAVNMQSFQEIWYSNVYNQVDVRYYPSAEGSLEYDVICNPGFDARDLNIVLNGVEALSINNKGGLVIRTSIGEMELPAPVAYQQINGVRTVVASAYRLTGSSSFTFDLGTYDEANTLIIDPIALRWATWVNTNSSSFNGGGSGHNHGHGIWVDPTDGAIYMVARVDGQTNLITPGAYETSPNGGVDLIVGKYFEPAAIGGSGTRVWQTYIGGAADDNPYALEQGPDGNIYITGYTASSDFPLIGGTAFGTTAGLDNRSQTTDNTFILKITPDGQSVKAAVIGGNGDDGSFDLRITAQGDVIVCGNTSSSNLSTLYPGTGAVNRAAGYYNNGGDVHLWKINQNLSSIMWMQNFGGTNAELATIMNVNNSNGDIYLAGYTNSTNFPVLLARQSTLTGTRSGFIQKIQSNGTRVWSSYFNSASSRDTRILCMEFNTARNELFFGGITTGLNASNLTSGAFDITYNGGTRDFFVSRMDTAQTLIASTYVGGNNDEVNMMGLNVDLNNEVYVFGYTNSTTFPVTSDALQTQLNNTGTNGTTPDNDKVFFKLPSTLSGSLLYSTYYGGSRDDYDPVGQRGIKFSSCRIYTIVTAESNNIPLTAGALNTQKLSSTSIYEPGLVVWANPPDLQNNSIIGNQVICAGQEPTGLTGSVPNYILPQISRNQTNSAYPATLPNTITYTWQRSSDGIAYTNISPGGDNQNLAGSAIGVLNETTFFRRIINGDACVIPGAADQIVTVQIFSVPATVSNVSCFGGNDGSIDANPNGVAPFNYVWSNGASSEVISGLTAGSYSVTVTDANGCIASATFEVGQPLAPLAATISSTPALCFALDGTAGVNVSGGTAPYTYLWNNGGSTSMISGVAAGSYSVLITDNEGCVLTKETEVQALGNIDANAINVLNVACKGQATGSFAIQVTGGTAPIQFSLDGGNFTAQSSYSGLPAGTYTVVVKDNNGCEKTVVVHITEPDTEVTASAGPQQNITCTSDSNGSATVIANGGNGSYTYTWTPNVGSTATVNNLSVGQYTVVVRDANNCAASSVLFTIQALDLDAPEFVTLSGDLDTTLSCSDAAGLALAQAWSPVATDPSGNVQVLEIPGAFVPSQQCPQAGTYTNIFTARDRCLNETIEFIQVITIIDTIAPQLIGVPDNIAQACGDFGPVPTVTATDNCQGTIVPIYSERILGQSCPAILERKWVATDACGNFSEAIRTVTIDDEIAPVINGVPADAIVSCSAIPAPAQVTVSDNCSQQLVALLSEDSIPGASNCSYRLIRTWSVSDACGNPAMKRQELTVVDTTGPQFVAIDAVHVSCVQDIPVFTPVATDNCDTDLIVALISIDTLGNFPCNGALKYKWSATDNCINVAYLEAFVYVADTVAPYFTSVPADTTIECGTIVPESFAYAMDACGFVEVSSQDSEVQGVGCNRTITRTFTATDACGRIATYEQIITIGDSELPVWGQLPSNVEVTCSNLIPAVATNLAATDNCGQPVIDYLGQSQQGTNCDFTITRTWKASDVCGNAIFHNQLIRVRDNVAPTFTSVPENILINCTESVPASGATATDNCGSATVTQADTQEQLGCQFITRRVFTATDACGNSTTYTQLITRVDSVNPYFTSTILPYIHVACDELDELALPTAADNCSTPVVTFTDVLNSGGCLGTLQRTYRAQDACGNFVTAVQFIAIVDNQGPVISAPDTVYYECNETVLIPVASAQDACTEVVSFTSTPELIPGTCPDSYTIVWRYEAVDLCDNVSRDSTVIIVRDTRAPQFTFVPADSTVLCNQSLPEVVYPVAEDNCDTAVVITLTTTETEGDCESEYTLVRTFRANDNCGNFAEHIQYIHVVDTIAPTFPEQITTFTYTCGEEAPLVTPVVVENCGAAELTSNDGPWLEDNCLGYFIRTWTAEDACGNSTTLQQIINKIDTVRPTIVASITASRPCDDYNVALATASDNCDEEVNLTFVDVPVSGGCAGKLLRTYTATDDCGNVAEFFQIITLTDSVLPVPSFVPANRTVQCGQEWSFDVPTFDDNCDEELELNSDVDTLISNCRVVYTAYWSALDNCGNLAEVTQIITVTDTVAPYWMFVPASLVIGCGEPFVLETPTAADLCDADVEVSITDTTLAGDCPAEFTIQRLFRAFDDCGNSIMAFQIIQVVDTVAPAFIAESVPSQLYFECTEVPVGIEPETLADCSNVTVSVSDTVFSVSSCETNGAFVYTAMDACGNRSEPFFQYYTIRDTQAPEVAPFMIEIDRPCNDYLGTYISATDLCSGIIISFEDRSFSGTCLGHIERTYTVQDSCGNIAEGLFVQIITLIDTIAPEVVEAPENLSFECAEGLVIPSFNAQFTDNCDPDGVEVVFSQTETAVECFTIINRRWIAVDNCGNRDTVTQVITITDTQLPYFTYVPEDFTVSCEEEIEFEQATAYDNCSGNISVLTSDTTIQGLCIGHYTIVRTFTTRDECGLEKIATQTIHVVDEDGPVFTFVPQGGLVNCLDFEPEMATAIDSCSTAVVDMEESSESFSLTVQGVSYCGIRYTYLWLAMDACGNTTEETTVYNVFDTSAPYFNETLPTTPIHVQCADDVPALVTLTASDACSTASVERTIENMNEDTCGNKTIKVKYRAFDTCGNEAFAHYLIIVEDTEDPVFTTELEEIVLDCNAPVPAPAQVSATDNCSSVTILYNQVISGPEMPQGAVAACRLSTPSIAQATGCQAYYNNTSWAMWLGSNPNGHKYFRVVSGNLYTMNNGTLLLNVRLENSQNPALGGFDANVVFGAGQNWAQWSAQSFPTSFKADCGGVDANFAAWSYHLLQNTPGAELTGYGAYSGSALTLGHAPVSKYFGFQQGDGANNLTPGEGFGGWFEYTGTILLNNNLLYTANAKGGDFAFNIDCCPRTVIHRCWTATDCSGNNAVLCQTIRYEGSTPAGNVNIGEPTGNEPGKLEGQDAFTIELDVFPNPATEMTTFTFVAAEDALTTIEVFDMAGAKVAQVFSTQANAGGTYKTELNVSRFATGIYMYRLINGGTTEMGRLVISK